MVGGRWEGGKILFCKVDRQTAVTEAEIESTFPDYVCVSVCVCVYRNATKTWESSEKSTGDSTLSFTVWVPATPLS